MFQCRDACWCWKCVENSNIVCNCHSGPKMSKYNVGHQCWYSPNIAWTCLKVGPKHWPSTLRQHSHNVVPTSVPNVEEQCCHNVYTLLPECCLSIGNVGQNSHRLMATLGFRSKYNIGTTFTQCGLHIDTMLLGCLKVPTVGIVTMLGTYVETTLVPMLSQHCRRSVSLAHMSGPTTVYCTLLIWNWRHCISAWNWMVDRPRLRQNIELI